MANERAFTHLLCGRTHSRDPSHGNDEAIARLATRQSGIVLRRQLRELDVGRRSIEHRRLAGRLRTLFPGVYSVGHEAISLEGRALAAIGSFHGQAWATHRTALRLRGVIEGRTAIHVSAPQPRATRRGVIVHRSRLRADEFSIVEGIPTATVERALLELSASCRPDELRRLFKRAEFENKTSLDAVLRMLDRYPRRRGRRNLAEMTAAIALTVGRSRSELEDRFHSFLAERELPWPETNVTLDLGGSPIEVDCLWREAGLVVELDGARAHHTASGFEDDRARDRKLVARGLAVMRVTWAHLHRDPDALETELRSALANGMRVR